MHRHLHIHPATTIYIKLAFKFLTLRHSALLISCGLSRTLSTNWLAALVRLMVTQTFPARIFCQWRVLYTSSHGSSQHPKQKPRFHDRLSEYSGADAPLFVQCLPS